MHKKNKISRLQYIASSSELIEQACAGGIKWVQLRIKNANKDFIFEEAIKARRISDQYNTVLIINDFPEIAIEVKADGVHLGKADISVADAKKIVGKDFIIGATANTYEEVKNAITAGVDYIGLGPFRFTETKQNLSPLLGLNGYNEILDKLKNEMYDFPPIISIGGIVKDDVASLMSTGVYGIAVSGLITHSKNKADIITKISSTLEYFNKLQSPINSTHE